MADEEKKIICSYPEWDGDEWSDEELSECGSSVSYSTPTEDDADCFCD